MDVAKIVPFERGFSFDCKLDRIVMQIERISTDKDRFFVIDCHNAEVFLAEFFYVEMQHFGNVCAAKFAVIALFVYFNHNSFYHSDRSGGIWVQLSMYSKDNNLLFCLV